MGIPWPSDGWAWVSSWKVAVWKRQSAETARVIDQKLSIVSKSCLATSVSTLLLQPFLSYYLPHQCCSFRTRKIWANTATLGSGMFVLCTSPDVHLFPFKCDSLMNHIASSVKQFVLFSRVCSLYALVGQFSIHIK